MDIFSYDRTVVMIQVSTTDTSAQSSLFYKITLLYKYAAGAAEKMDKPAQQAIGDGAPTNSAGAELASVTLGKSNAKILSTAE